ncbi:hypothetical protein PHYPSEUDO_000766 [Phytophthora pseudosyringae]|uniref:Uncharacterized protein n=1 Tax=Phytophthora pseudosyringae TaxID=221518 RepID=A0A8T1WIK5_9STRA|nr:hypothetical protein PHYPSEUDO_000766 [Phytophthora pseudosyringae]
MSPAGSCCFDRVCSYGKKVANAWLKLQVGHRGGKYSIERLLALEEYTRTVSTFRVVLVCLGTPVLMMTLVISQELVPLKEPSAGWKANYGFWVRLAFLGGVIAHTAAVQAHFLVDRVKLTRCQRMSIASLVGITFSLSAMSFASKVVFPIPFIAISGVPLFYALLLLSFRIVAGWRFFQAMMADIGQTTRYINYSASQVLMAATYPCYQMLFTVTMGTRYELPVILLLPLIKLFMKYLLSITTAHMEDLMPEAVIFTADFFNALYLATCMQRTSSPITIVFLVALDFSHTIVGLFSLHRRTNNILARLHETIGDSNEEGDKFERKYKRDQAFSID